MIAIKSEALLLFRKCITSKPSTQIIRRNLNLTRALKCNNKICENDDNKNHNQEVDEILSFFENTNCTDEVKKVPTRVLKQRKSRPEHLYLVDNKAAEQIIDLIEDDILADPRKVIDVNPGLGLITRKLLAKGVPLVNLMEQNVRFFKNLVGLQREYPDRTIIREADIFNIWKLAYQDKADDGNRIATIFADFPHIKWGTELGLKIIGTVTNVNFLRHMVMDTVRQCGIVSYGRPCFYLCMPPSIWMRLTCTGETGLREYKSMSVLFQLFFDHKILGEIPRKAFLPWAPACSSKKRRWTTRNNKLDLELMYLVKIRGKIDLFTRIIDGKHIQPLWFFVNHHMVARTSKVIASMEAWEPGCGSDLIRRDFNIFTQFGDLSPEQVLELFKEFTTWNGYRNTFIPSMENSLQKMEQLLF